MSTPTCRRARQGQRPLTSLAFALALLGLLLTPASASAHAEPVQSSPPANAILDQPPTRVTIWFSERIEPRLSHLAVYDAARHAMTAGPAAVDPAQPYRLSVPLRPHLPDGTYTVAWQVVSADDGHATAGAFAFGIGVPPTAPAVSATPRESTAGAPTPAGVIGRWLTYLGALLVLGTAAFSLLIVRPADRRGVPPADPGDRRLPLAVVALGLLILGQLLRLLDELAAAAPADPAGLLLGSRIGALWLGQSGLIAAAAGLIAVRRVIRRWLWPGLLLLALAAITDLAAAGHAAAGGLLAYGSLIQATLPWASQSALYLRAATLLLESAPVLTLALDWLHLAAAGVWIGGLITLAVWAPDGPPDLLGTAGRRFARLALLGMGIILLTGLYNTWLYIDSPSAYLASGYGRGLLLKHLFVILLLGLAAFNRLVSVPLLAGRRALTGLPGPVRRLLAGDPRRAIRLEAGAGVLVLLATGLLTSLPPTRAADQILRNPSRVLALARRPFSVTLPAEPGAEIRLTITPGRVGPNTYAVQVDEHGRPAADIHRVVLELTPLDLTSGGPSIIDLAARGPGTFTASGLVPSTSGVWQARVLVYRRDGSIASAATTMEASSSWLGLFDERARTALARARAAMARLRSARMVEALGSGTGAPSITLYAFAAPDRQRIDAGDGGTVVQIGATTYTREQTDRAWRIETGTTPYRWPDDAYAYLTAGVGGIVIGEDVILGEPCTVVAFYLPPADALYEEWIGQRDNLIHREVMVAPSHYMTS
ncbi:MAG: copper resistance protein CopC/CopD, partial [Chloroflexi bacterium]|nr:copper resistance protein CopC/CopD [Chloroflexota bacterium]